jgi:hypothetical protein
MIDKDNVKNKGCPACKIPTVTATSFNDFANHYIGPFTSKTRLKFGELLQCTVCGMHWYTCEGSTWVDAVRDNDLRTIDDWSNRDLSVKPEHLAVLRSIGCTPSDYYGNLSEFIRIPCKCILTNGNEIDKALVSIQRRPPVGFSAMVMKSFLYIDEIAKVQPSEFSLPLEVRVATSQAREVSMGFSPTVVLAPYNILYILNGPNNFFQECDIKGNQITLAKAVKINFKTMKYESTSIPGTLVIADWWPGANEIF